MWPLFANMVPAPMPEYVAPNPLVTDTDGLDLGMAYDTFVPTVIHNTPDSVEHSALPQALIQYVPPVPATKYVASAVVDVMTPTLV